MNFPWKTVIKSIKDNPAMSDSEIARQLSFERPDAFPIDRLASLRRRVGEARCRLVSEGMIKQMARHGGGGGPKIGKDSKVKVSGTGLELDRVEWMKVENENIKLRERVRMANCKMEVLSKEAAAAHDVIDAMTELKNRGKEVYKIDSRKFSTSEEATAFLVLSDTHIEENVDPSTVNSLNKYDPGIAKDSFSNFFRKGVNLCDIFGKDIQIKTIVLAILGDIISGHIHEELLEDNNLSPIQATMLAADLIGTGIQHILKRTKCDLVVPCKIGNHGRTTAKRRVSTEYKNSYEWMMYHQLAKEFKNEGRVKFIIDNSYMTYLDVYGRLIRLHHGHNLKYWGGVGGITIPVAKAIAQWDKERKAYLDVFGHFHNQMLDTGVHGKFVSNGSMVGYNAFAVSIKASYEQPQQAFFLIDKKRGKTTTAPIFVRSDS